MKERQSKRGRQIKKRNRERERDKERKKEKETDREQGLKGQEIDRETDRAGVFRCRVKGRGRDEFFCGIFNL